MPGSPSERPDSSPISSENPSYPRPRTPPSAQLKNMRVPLADLIGAQFSSFEYESDIVFPFQDETARDETFQKELNEMLLDAALQAHVWASARPFHETDMATRNFEQQVMAVQAQEKEQEKTRQRLNDFVTRMRSALAALTGML